jgi:hypothetical protein
MTCRKVAHANSVVAARVTSSSWAAKRKPKDGKIFSDPQNWQTTVRQLQRPF